MSQKKGRKVLQMRPSHRKCDGQTDRPKKAAYRVRNVTEVYKNYSNFKVKCCVFPALEIYIKKKEINKREDVRCLFIEILRIHSQAINMLSRLAGSPGRLKPGW